MELPTSNLDRKSTVPELFDALPFSFFSVCGMAFLGSLCVLPFCFSLVSYLHCFSNGYYSGYFYVWVSCIQIIGNLCLITTVFLLGKKTLTAKRRLVTGKDYLIHHPLSTLIFVLLLWSCVALAFSTNPLQSLLGDAYRNEGVMMFFQYGGYLALAMAVGQNRERVRGLMAFFVALAIPIGVVILIETKAMYKALGFVGGSGAVVFENSNHCAYYLCLAIMGAVVLILTARNWKRAGLWIGCFALLLTALLKNNSLGPYLAVIGGIGLLLIHALLYCKTLRRRMAVIVAVFIVVSVAYSLSSSRLVKDLFKLSSDTTAIIAADDKLADKEIGSAGSGRFKLWQTAVILTMERPITGWGPDNLGAEYSERLHTQLDQPHCVPLQIAAQMGIPGLLLYLAFVVIFARQVWVRRRQMDALAMGLVAGVFAFFLSGLVASTMFYTSPYFFMWLGLAMSQITERENKYYDTSLLCVVKW